MHRDHRSQPSSNAGYRPAGQPVRDPASLSFDRFRIIALPTTGMIFAEEFYKHLKSLNYKKISTDFMPVAQNCGMGGCSRRKWSQSAATQKP
ncbi:hypothetical protein [Rhizobium sp. RAF56]|uniref:hypothetical protein n=1 Tax=Rhizobium sp. RAF56 TaxID=3233062 RepID=UPI003F9549C4